MKNGKHIGFRVEKDTLDKLRVVAEYNGRSINGHLLYLARQSIKAFEEEHGKIDLEESQDV